MPPKQHSQSGGLLWTPSGGVLRPDQPLMINNLDICCVLVRTHAAAMTSPCGPSCECGQLASALCAEVWQLATPGSKVHSDIVQLLPQIAAELNQNTGHQHRARLAALNLYNRWGHTQDHDSISKLVTHAQQGTRHKCVLTPPYLSASGHSVDQTLQIFSICIQHCITLTIINDAAAPLLCFEAILFHLCPSTSTPHSMAASCSKKEPVTTLHCTVPA
jgi:hypothetical protein